jgi:hypothetical protein
MRINFDRIACSNAIARCYGMFQEASSIAMVTRCAIAFTASRAASDSSPRELTLNANFRSYVLTVQRVFDRLARTACTGPWLERDQPK